MKDLEIQEIVELVEKYISLNHKLTYYDYMGFDNEVENSEYQRITRLFNKKMILKLKKKLLKINKENKDYDLLIKLINFVIQAHSDNKTAKYRFRNSRIENSYSIELSNKIYNFFDINMAQSLEQEQINREILENFRIFMLKKMLKNDYRLLKRDYLIHTRFLDDDYLEINLGFSDCIISKLKKDAELFLLNTEENYKYLLNQYSKPILSKSEIYKKCDINRILRGSNLDVFFPSDRLVESIERTIDFFCDKSLRKYVNLNFDRKEGKITRAFCNQIKIPENIIATVNTILGYQDYFDALHEIGHLLQNIHISIDSNILQKRFKCKIVEECYAILFERLLVNDNWYKFIFGKNLEIEIKSYIKFVELLTIRRTIGMMLYEIEIYTNGLKSLSFCKKIYKEILSNVFQMDVCPDYCIHFIDPEFYSFKYVIASILEAYIENFLLKNYGKDWFRNIEAQNLLKKLWNGENSINVLKQLVKIDDIDFSILIQRYNS